MNHNLSFNSVVEIPVLKGSAAFTTNTSEVFKENEDMVPVKIADGYEYMPWGANNELPYKILELIDSDETLSTCQMFNAEVCYGSGLVYNTSEASSSVKKAVDNYMMDNDMASYFLGVCQDIKHFAFCVSVIILSNDGSQIARILRKEACYCRFAPADKEGNIPYILYANWRKSISNKNEVDLIMLKNGELTLIESKAGTNFGSGDLKAFRLLKKSDYAIGPSCIICLTDKAFPLMEGVYALPVTSI